VGARRGKVVAIDLGMKRDILANLTGRGFEVEVVPAALEVVVQLAPRLVHRPGRAQDPDAVAACQELLLALRHRVVAAGVERMASADALHPHPCAAGQPVALDGGVGVLRAAGAIAAGRRHPGEQALIGADGSQTDLPHPPIPDRSTSDLSASRSSAWLAFAASGLAIRSRSQPAPIVASRSRSCSLTSSRSLRRTRFRWTAPPSVRGVLIPIRVSARSVLRNRRTSNRVERTDPERPMASKSALRRSVGKAGTSRLVRVRR